MVEAVYQIEQLGQPTNNWIIARLYESNGDVNPACYISQGNPDAGGTSRSRRLSAVRWRSWGQPTLGQILYLDES